MTRLFLSYARGDDESFVERLYHAMCRRGFDVWWDRISMPSRLLTFHQEIRDAIVAHDRLVLVVGPRAVSSDYVRQEWQFALLNDKVVTPILRLGDHQQVPDELRLLHAEDFRDDDRFGFHLDNLTRQLSDPLPPLGKLIAVPSLPPHFLARPERVAALRDALRADLDRPVVVGGAAARVGVHGMGGIGKSVLASALARDRKVREAFPDGIIWVGLGSLPEVVTLQRRLHRDLGGDGAFESEHQGREALRKCVTDRAVLLVLDDVWRRADADWFDVLGPRCRALLTTRDLGLLTSLGGTHHIVELLAKAEALELLALAAAMARGALPEEAGEIVDECGRLPLALALCGGMIRRGLAWSAVLQQLRQARIDRIADRHAVEAHHESVWHAIHVSVEFLPSDERRRFLELAVFPPHEAIPEAAIATFWAHTGGLDHWQTNESLITLEERSLLQRTSNSQQVPTRNSTLHDLVYDYVQRAVPDARGLHERLLSAYRTDCKVGWPDGPNDGYFFTHLSIHLVGAGHAGELAELLSALPWLEAKIRAGLVFDLAEDYNLALRLSPDGHALLPWDGFVRQQAAALNVYPELLLQQAANEPVDSPVSRAARERLESPGEPRHWLDRMNRPQRLVPSACKRVIVGEGIGMLGVCVPADGSFAVSSSEDGTLRVWDLRTGEPGTILKNEDLGTIWSLDVSADGRTAVSGGMLGTVGVWDLDRGVRWHVRQAHEGYVPVAITADGTRAVSGGEDQTVRVWDLWNGECLLVLEGHAGAVNGVGVSSDGHVALSGGEDRAVRVWDLREGRCRFILGDHTAPVRSVCLSPDGRVGLSGDTDSRIRVWDLETGVCRGVLEGHSKWIFGVAVATDGRTAVSCASDETVRLWDLATRTCRAVLYGHGARVMDVALVPDGSVAVSSSQDGTLRVWDLRLAKSLPPIEGHTRRVSRVAITSDGNRGVSASYDGTLRTWDMQTGECQAVMQGHVGPVHGVVVLHDGLTAVSAGDQTLRLWDLRTGLCHAVLEGHTDDVICLELTPDEQTLVSGSRDQTVRVWDLQARVCRAVLRGHELPPSEHFYESESIPMELYTSHPGDRGLRSVLITSDGWTVVSVAMDRRMRVWDLLTGTCQGEYLEYREKGRRILSDLPLIRRDQREGHRTIQQGHSRVFLRWQDEATVGRFPCSQYTQSAPSADGQSIIIADGREVYILRPRRR